MRDQRSEAIGHWSFVIRHSSFSTGYFVIRHSFILLGRARWGVGGALYLKPALRRIERPSEVLTVPGDTRVSGVEDRVPCNRTT